jgi:hypothetical protein
VAGMRKRARVDKNHRETVEAYEAMGYLVLSLASQGGGCPDLLIWRRDRGLELVEVKGKTGTLTPDQQDFIAKGWPVRVVRSLEDVVGVKIR